MNYVSLAQSGVFIENLGQWEEAFDFKMPVNNGGVFISPEEVVFKFVKIQKTSKEKSSHSVDPHSNAIQVGDLVLGHSYRVSFLGGNPKASAKMGTKRKGYHNYIIGNDRSKWKSKVGLYESFQFQEIYQNVNIDYYFNKDGNLKYDLILKPGADPSQIKLQYEGTNGLDLIYGNLRVKTSVEDVLESAPYAYQNIKGKVKEVKCSYVLEDNVLSFSIGRYNKKYPLVIDPVLIFSTYSGSSSDNFGFTATYGEEGEAYGGGIIYASSIGKYPVSLGAFQDTFQGGNVDVALTKFLADGTDIIYSTYLGGSSNEVPHSLIEGLNKELIIIGSTGSVDFPTTVDAYDTSFTVSSATGVSIGGTLSYSQGSDLFVTKLDSTGGVLKGSTFFGGDGADGINLAFSGTSYNYGDGNRSEVIVDSLGVIYCASSSYSTNLPNAGLHIPSGSSQDGIVFSFDSDLKNLRWNTYISSANDETVSSLKIRGNDIYVAGISDSTFLGNLYSGGFSPQALGSNDGFIARLNAQNGSVTNFTYNGTPQRDGNFLLDLDDLGNVYVLGQTRGKYPVLGDNVFSQTNGSLYINMFNSDLSQSIKSMTFGDNSLSREDISPTAFMVDYCGNVYVSGWGGQISIAAQGKQTLPVTNNSSNVQGARQISDGYDFYIMVLDASWEKINFGAYFGASSAGISGDHVDGGTSRYNKNGTFYQAVCAGCGGTDNFPTTNGAYSNTNGASNCNLAVVKLKIELDAVVDFEPDLDSSCIPFEVNLVNKSYNTDIYRVTDSDGITYQGEPKKLIVSKPGNQSYKIVAIDTVCGFRDSITLNFFGIIDSLKAGFESDNDSCSGEFMVNFRNTSKNANSFFWSFGDGKFSLDENPSHEFENEGTYKVDMIISSKECISSDTSSQQVVVKSKNPNGRFIIDYEPCRDGTRAVFRSLGKGFENYIWSINGVIESDTSILSYDFKELGNYTIRLESIDSACGYFFFDEQTIEINDKDYTVLMPNVFTPNADGNNDEFGLIGDYPENFFNEFTFKVFNRWGVELFSTSESIGKWTGFFDGERLSEGVYYYVLNYSDICGNSSEEKGFVHLLD